MCIYFTTIKLLKNIDTPVKFSWVGINEITSVLPCYDIHWHRGCVLENVSLYVSLLILTQAREL